MKTNEQYYFSIGSVDSFERKMEAAQAELGVPVMEHLPVIYRSEVSIASELMKFAPSLLVLGVLFYMLRGMSGAGGGSAPRAGRCRPTWSGREGFPARE